MSASPACPYCNAILPALGGACPRCGEAIGAAPAPAAVPTPAHPSRRRMLVAVAGIVLLAGGVWVAVAGHHHIRGMFVPTTPPAKPVVVAPAEMPGLGYLPESTEAILAIQVPFLLERLDPAAQNEPTAALVALGLPQQVAEIIDRASAVGLKNVDQLVVGLSFEGHALPPQTVVVVHARQPFDLAAIAGKAKAHELKKDGRTLYAAKAGPIPEVYWWQAADRVLVATIAAGDFKDVPGLPRAGIDHLRPALSALIRDQVAGDACAWLAASSDNWDKYVKPYVLFQVPPFAGRNDLAEPARRLRTVAISIPHDPAHRLDARITEKSAEAGAELRGLLTERFRDEPVEVSGEAEMCRLQMENEAKHFAALMRLLGVGK
jgi:hypothetical protein